MLARRNNWLAAVVIEPAHRDEPFRWGLASADVSTGEVQVMQRQDGTLHQQRPLGLPNCSAAHPITTPPGAPTSCG